MLMTKGCVSISQTPRYIYSEAVFYFTTLYKQFLVSLVHLRCFSFSLPPSDLCGGYVVAAACLLASRCLDSRLRCSVLTHLMQFDLAP